MNETQWRDRFLGEDREDVRKHNMLIAEYEGKWERLESRTDFVADQEREKIREVLPALYARRDARLRRVAAGEERERIVNTVLWPTYNQKLGSLEKKFERMATNPDVPTNDEFLELSRDNVEVGRLGLILFEATGLEEFRRPFDAVRALKSHWFDVNRDRERLFHLIGPGNKPRLGEPEWLEHARRLTELRGSSNVQRENAHAVR
jgi:hypothetical protein